MSHNYYLEPRMPYDELLQRLPDGVTLQPVVPGMQRRSVGGERDHVLLADAHGNTLWLWELTAEEFAHGCFRKLAAVGSAVFEQYMLQGPMVHFIEAFASIGLKVVDPIYGEMTVEDDSRSCPGCQPGTGASS